MGLFRTILGATMALSAFPTVSAQELEPRTYANSPVGFNFIAVGYAHSTGNVFLDPALPIEGLDADVNLAFVRYVRTLSLFGRQAKVKALMPYSSGDWEGTLEGQQRTRSANGLGDAHASLEVNIFGAPALSREEFADYDPRTIVGVGLRVVAPTGEYDPTKLINLGSNRWVLKPEIGFSRAVRKWAFEVATSVWLFADNDEFLEDSTLEQDALVTLKVHAIRTFRPGFWAAFGAGFGRGGTTRVDGVVRNTLQENWRGAFMLAYPVTPSQGLMIRVATGNNQGAGSDFDTLTLIYQYAWSGAD